MHSFAKESGSIARQDYVLKDWVNLVFPALSRKYPVMADACLHVVALQIRPELAAEFMGRHRLADGANIVALALDRKKHSLADRIRVDALAVPLQLTERERMVLKDELHRLQVCLLYTSPSPRD